MMKRKKPTMSQTGSDIDKAILREIVEHPSLVKQYGFDVAKQLAADRINREKTTTPTGKKAYQRRLMRVNRLHKRGLKVSNQKEFDTVWRAIFGNDKPPPVKDPYIRKG